MEESTLRQLTGPGDRPAPAVAWLPGRGELVASRFRVERVIGEGGMGAVVAAEHIDIGGKVAIKFLHPDLARDAEALERFVREARIAAQIRSEHVVRVLDVGTTDDGLPYIVMDLLEGADLGRVVRSGPMPLALALDCVLQAAEALAEAHAQGIVHRDVKPGNLWLSQHRDGSPCVRVLDFGISKLMPTDRHTAAITDTKASFGSPAYMSPEQIRSAKRVDHRTDVWALGVVLHELLTQALPFDADSIAGIFAAIISDAPSPVRRARPDAPAEVERALLACFEKDATRRISLADLAQALRPFAGPAGQIAAERIARMGAPTVSLIPAAPPTSDSDLIAFGQTEPSLVQRAPVPMRSPLLLGVLVGLFVAVTASTVGVYAVTRRTATARSPTPPPPITTESAVVAPDVPAPAPPPAAAESTSVAPTLGRAPAAAPLPKGNVRHRAPATRSSAEISDERE